MTTSVEKKQEEVDKNYDAFQVLLPELMKTNEGDFVVMREKKVVKVCDTVGDAMIHATKTYDDGLFSIQEVTEKSVDLGWFSHALPHNTI